MVDPTKHSAQKFRDFKITESDKGLIEKLGAGHREILLAKGSYLDMAAQLSISPGTVRSRLNRARAALAAIRAAAQ